MKSAKQNSIKLSYGKLKTDKAILEGDARGVQPRELRELILRKNLHSVSLVSSVRDKSPWVRWQVYPNILKQIQYY